jgi:hypothetical protein
MTHNSLPPKKKFIQSELEVNVHVNGRSIEKKSLVDFFKARFCNLKILLLSLVASQVYIHDAQFEKRTILQ